MSASKLFTPKGVGDRDCFVTPYTHPDGAQVGYADAQQNGDALYPLRLGGDGAGHRMNVKKGVPVRTVRYWQGEE